MSRPHGNEYFEYGGYGLASGATVASNRCEVVVPAPSAADEVVFVEGYTVKAAYSGASPQVAFARTDGTEIWRDPIPAATGVVGTRDFPGKGLWAGKAGEGLSIAITAGTLTTCECYVQYRYL